MGSLARRGLVAALLAVGMAHSGCESQGLRGASPHARYADALRDAGLDTLAAGRLWLAAADSALIAADTLDLPASTRITVSAGGPRAVGRAVPLQQGERLRIRIIAALGDSARVFVDLFDTGGEAPRLVDGTVAFADTLWIERDAAADETLVLRIQPELLGAGSIGLDVETVPSLGFPVAGGRVQDIGSVWADPRDSGARRHEGIDIFADRGTPAVAAGPGRVARVEETPRGGRVVWLRLDDRAVSLYYAHLDTHLVASGARVESGDTLGRVGNTGNAAGTPPHLHFGIYGRGGAVDPSPFVRGRPAR